MYTMVEDAKGAHVMQSKHAGMRNFSKTTQMMYMLKHYFHGYTNVYAAKTCAS
jgi:hypothetical protein